MNELDLVLDDLDDIAGAILLLPTEEAMPMVKRLVAARPEIQSVDITWVCTGDYSITIRMKDGGQRVKIINRIDLRSNHELYNFGK